MITNYRSQANQLTLSNRKASSDAYLLIIYLPQLKPVVIYFFQFSIVKHLISDIQLFSSFFIYSSDWIIYKRNFKYPFVKQFQTKTCQAKSGANTVELIYPTRRKTSKTMKPLELICRTNKKQSSSKESKYERKDNKKNKLSTKLCWEQPTFPRPKKDHNWRDKSEHTKTQ